MNGRVKQIRYLHLFRCEKLFSYILENVNDDGTGVLKERAIYKEVGMHKFDQLSHFVSLANLKPHIVQLENVVPQMIEFLVHDEEKRTYSFKLNKEGMLHLNAQKAKEAKEAKEVEQSKKAEKPHNHWFEYEE
jgi:hypothetical protein